MEQCAAERNESLAGRDLTAPLFVPGDRPDRIRKACERGARAIVIDLEDAVAPTRKDAARAALSQVTVADAVAVLVRVNASTDRDLLAADLAALRPVLSRVAGVVLPKVESVATVRDVAAELSGASGCVPALVPTVETARGVHAAYEIAAASPLVHTLLFGPVDLSAELGITATAAGTELVTARSTVVLACAAARIAAPLDGPWTGLDDYLGLAEATRHARNLGFGGKVAIHPRQLPVLTTGFAPTRAEISWANEVDSVYTAAVSHGVGVARLSDGTFIDPPVAERARRILSRAHRTAAAS
ncbi:HpcH/HpaI aldolase/citrate lyase family protein [Nocardia jinanensis]|uniref:HpcH/HpaI aldolase/citrate lyase family protein n=1 Tax=Nocardia jinanensis TaxID=382504 RepID=UPI001E36FAB2|nr:CoA ester lyase [Nocardia jinanensis]